MTDYEKEISLTLDCYFKNNKSKRSTAKELGVSRSTVARRIESAKENIIFQEKFKDNEINNVSLENKIKELQNEVTKLSKEKISDYELKKFFYRIKETGPNIPDWISNKEYTENTTGVPCISLSDLHWGEVVDKNQVMGCNKYNLEIARKRLNNFYESICDMFFNRIANPEYPGIVVNLLGDLIAGNIHEDLQIANEKEVLEIVQDLYGVLIKFFSNLIEKFGRVFVVSVHGNHGRLTNKPRSKNSAQDNFDWHIACLLQSFFELSRNDNIKFLISDCEDVDYKIYNTVFRATHGAQFKGGNGIIGSIGPIVRGDSMKRVQARDMDREYDILLCGHFHTSLILPRVISNGSLVGMGEYAFKNKFPFEDPRQTAWITHPDFGVTFPMAIQVDNLVKNEKTNWVSWRD